MNMWLRVFLTWLRAMYFLPRIADPLAPARLPFRVLPSDLDINTHMNNGRYLQIMDLGRYDWLLRTGTWTLCRQKKWTPVLSALMIRYRRGLDPFERYDLETKVLGWDGIRCFIEQRLIKTDGSVASLAVLSAVFYDLKNKTSVPVEVVLELMGFNAPSPALPAYITSWQAAETDLKEVTKQ